VAGDGLAAIRRYWESLARPDGGYGWPDNPHACLTVTYAAIACYRLLGLEPPRKSAMAEFLRGAYPMEEYRHKQRPLRRFDFEQIQSLAWLGEPLDSFRAEAADWVKPSVFSKYYEFNGNQVLQQETGAILSRKLLDLPPTPEWRDYITSRRRPNGSFNNTPAADASDGHVVNTLWALLALRALGSPLGREHETADWIRGCQLPGGGFTYAPHAEIAGHDHVVYTWAALQALQLLKSTAADEGAARRYLLSLWNADGGFGDRPGRASNPLATQQALEALATLGPLSGMAGESRRAIAPAASVPSHLKVFTIQIEAPGNGSPREAVNVAKALGIHLWGAKNCAPGWIEFAQKIARQEQAPVQFFVANEEYGTYVSVPGLGTYSHLADVTAPAGSDFGASMADDKRPVPWPKFLSQRIAPLRRASGNNVWQFNENEELSRILLDQAVEEGTYSSISEFHFGSEHFLQTQPFLNRYRDVLPFIGLQDAHTWAWWWMEYLVGFRTLFLAAEPTWEAWLEALRHNWVATVRHDIVTNFETQIAGTSNKVRGYMLERSASWRWWGDRPDDIRRPWASLTAVTPQDEFDDLRPESGVNLCVRCWFDTKPFGTPKVPVTELVSFEVDGRAVSATHVAKPSGKGSRGDDYHLWPMPAGQPGKHSAVATVRMIRSGAVGKEKLEFSL